MRTPICNSLSLVLPVVAGAMGYFLARAATGATNLGEALAPYFVMAIVVALAAIVGELAAIAALLREERLPWLSWMGVAVNGLLLTPLAYFLVTADWR